MITDHPYNPTGTTRDDLGCADCGGDQYDHGTIPTRNLATRDAIAEVLWEQDPEGEWPPDEEWYGWNTANSICHVLAPWIGTLIQVARGRAIDEVLKILDTPVVTVSGGSNLFVAVEEDRKRLSTHVEALKGAAGSPTLSYPDDNTPREGHEEMDPMERAVHQLTAVRMTLRRAGALDDEDTP